MHPEPASPLGQAIAAIIAMLIAAIAEHAAEHPMLAPGLRAAIRRLETLSRRLEAMAAAWETGQSAEPRPSRSVVTKYAIDNGSTITIVIMMPMITMKKKMMMMSNYAPGSSASPAGPASSGSSGGRVRPSKAVA